MMTLWIIGLAWTTTAIATPPPNCTEWGTSELLATCNDCPLINESSGVVPAAHREDTWFTHNDAGGTPDLYAFDSTGVQIEVHSVVGGGFRDWEDIASGPCPTGVDAPTCLYIGDVGDNGETREEIDIWVVVEPAAGETAEVVANWRLRYPVEPHDCEAVIVHPCTGRVYLLTKERDGEPVVFRAPAEPTGMSMAADLELVATLSRTWFGDSGLITGADWSATGEQLAMRTYDGGWLWQTDPSAPDAHWTTPPDPIPIDIEGQGESIAFHPDGGLLTTTEGIPMRIVHLPCAATEDAAECPPPEPEDTGSPGETGEVDEEIDTSNPDSTSDPDEDTPDAVDPDATDTASADALTPPVVEKADCSCGGGSAGAWVFAGLLVGVGRRRRT